MVKVEIGRKWPLHRDELILTFPLRPSKSISSLADGIRPRFPLALGIAFALELTTEFRGMPPRIRMRFRPLASSGDTRMALLAPPPRTPRLALDDNDDLNRLRMRLTQVLATVVTVLATAWLCTFGAIAAILALMVAKHILVAILVMGLGVDAPRAPR